MFARFLWGFGKLKNYIKVMFAQLCEVISNHWIVYFKCVTLCYVIYILIKLFFKKRDYEFTQIHSFLSKTNPLDGLNGETCKRTGK